MFRVIWRSFFEPKALIDIDRKKKAPGLGRALECAEVGGVTQQ